jgi:predicted RND superfamily exporter protein
MSLFRLLSRHPLKVVAVAVLMFAGGALLSARLDLRTAFSELLPDDDPGVVALRKTQDRMGDLTLLLVGIRSPDVAANERYAEALTRRLRALPRSVCDIATYHVRDVAQLLESNRWLYAGAADLEAVRDRLRGEILQRKNPLALDLDDEDQEQEDRALEQRLDRSAPFSGMFPGGLLRSDKSPTVWVAALPPGGMLVEHPGEALLAATNQFIAEHPPASYHPEMQVEPAGPIITSIRNREALEHDLTVVGGLCLVVIPLSIGLYFRRLRAVLFVSVPGVLATVLAYATACVVYGYLTTATSFLVAFVLGNGTNYAIVLLSRYEEHRRAGQGAAGAMLEACGALWRPTGVAALACALSYLSLMVTGFRGFSQFGLIGAAGCLFAWLATFLVMPALPLLFDRRGPRLGARAARGGPLRAVARLIETSPRGVLAVGAVITVVMLAGATRFGRDPFEYDFRKLSIEKKLDQRAQQFDRERGELFGRWPEPTVILADRAEDLPALRAAIRKADADLPGPDVIGKLVSVDDLLPGTADEQRRKLALLAEIRRAANDPGLEQLEPAERRELERLRPPDTLRVLTPQDLPALARRLFTEADGTVGRVLLVYPPEHGLSLWDGRALLRIAQVLQHLQLPDGRQVDTSGSAVIFAAMIRAILKDGRLATMASLAAVILLVLLRVRPLRAAGFVIAGLLVGVCWMAGIAGWLGIKITFLNFIALPFIFGVGVEYAIHVVSEYQEHRSVRRTVISAGGPVALCSWSAIVGYGSLLAARNGALRGLGGVATLGEVTCLLAALVVMPAGLLLLRQATAASAAPHPPAGAAGAAGAALGGE